VGHYTLVPVHMDSEPSLPPVVAVVVTSDPGPWFEETLQALADQDYLNLSVLVIDAASTEDPTARVAAILPGAYVRRTERRVNFGTAANEIIGIVEGASHYLFCHDDVAPDPGAIRNMVEEAYRSNAAIVAPKLVEWAHPERLIDVGLGSDKVGVVHALVEPGELDQEQHDSVREIFVAPGGATLVRADMFATLGGFDPIVDHAGEDLNLSWRAHLAGAKIIVAPGARCRHLQATKSGLRPDPPPGTAAVADTNRMRTVLACYSATSLLWILPLAALFTLGEVLTLLVTGRPGAAGRRVVSQVEAFAHPGFLWRARRTAQHHRAVSDRSACRLQSGGNARLQAWIGARLDGPSVGLPFAPSRVRARRAAVPGTLDLADDDTAWAQLTASRRRAALVALPTADALQASGQIRPISPVTATPETPEGPPVVATGSWRLPLVSALVLLVVFVIGSRSLLGHTIPDVGQLPQTSSGVGHWWSAWLSTWQRGGLGSVGSSAPALGLLSLAGVIFFGAVGTLQQVLVLGPFVVGAFGAYRAARWWGSQRGRVAAMVAYVLVPLPYDALAHGHWDGLVAYAATPWMIGMIARISDSLPFPHTATRRIGGRLLGAGLLTALTAAFVPSYLFVVLVIGVGLALGSLIVAQPPVAIRLALVGLVAAAVGFVLLLPWSGRVISDKAQLFGLGAGSAGRLSFPTLLHFDTGPLGLSPLDWGLLVAAALPLVIGRSWRLAWAARLWILALVCVLWAWMGLRGWVPIADAEVALAPAGAALAASVGLGVVAFELDLPGYRFGWRQGASLLAAVGLLVMAVPVIGALGSGSWDLSTSGPSSTLGGLDRSSGGDYRILWVGAPDALPLVSSSLGDGQAFATSFDGLPDVTDQWATGASKGASVIRTDLRLAEGGLTTRLGHLLAPLGVRYLVIPDRLGSTAVATPDALLSGLPLQTDIKPVPQDTSSEFTVYSNAAWAPVRTVLPGPAVATASLQGLAGLRRLQTTSLVNSTPSLTGSRPDRALGPVTGGSDVYVAATPDHGWDLKVDGQTIKGTPAFGVGMMFKVPAGVSGRGTLTVATSGTDRTAQIIFAALWALVIVVVSADKLRRSRAGSKTETVMPEWFTPLSPHRGRPRRGAAVTNAPVGMGSDEVWIDA
jgi:GT2 family glycosyltransferase